MKDNGVGGLGGRVLRKSEGDQRPEKTSWSGDGEFIMLSGEVAAPVAKCWILRKEEQHERYRMIMKSESEIKTERETGVRWMPSHWTSRGCLPPTQPK